jgi:hypothetical protein
MIMEYINNGIFELEIKESLIPNAGLGVFTKEFIKKGEIIGEYTGARIDSDGNYTYILDNGKCIDAAGFPRCFVAMMNDSIGTQFLRNCEFIEKGCKVYAIATQNIPEDSELYVSYGVDFWRHNFKGDYQIAYVNTIKKLALHASKGQAADPLLKKERDFFRIIF